MVPTPPPSCTCGERRGLGRLVWHKAHCKRHLQEAVIGYPEEFNEWPLGRSVYANATTQVKNGAVARLVFNDFDFVAGGGELNLRGRDKLASMAATLPTCFAPVVIERTPYAPGLDEARRLVVLREFSAGPFPVPPERVLVGPPIANGQRGVESILVERNRLSSVLGGSAFNTPAGGGSGGGGAAGSGVGPGSFDGSGLTGSTVSGGFGVR